MEPAALEDALGDAAATLRSAGIEGARSEARLLVAHALAGASPEAWDGRTLRRFEGLVRHRARRAPLAQVTGVREFWSLDFRVTADTLTPRPESETLIECGLARLAGPRRILDLGTGSGCLLVTFLVAWPRACGVGVDVSGRALAVAAQNAARHRVSGRAAFVRGDWGAAFGGRFDLVVSNPPYVAAGEIAGLEPEVAVHEPRVAIDGGADGLDGFRRILPGLARLLAPRGLALLEHGPGQAQPLGALAAAAGLAVTGSVRDLAGRRRVLVLAQGGP